jgi:alanine racemase
MDAVSKKISLTASSFEFLESCLEFGLSKQVTIHIKVDTGLHRQGFSESDIEKLIKFLLANKDKFDVEGLYTHFAKAKDPNDKTYTLGQIKSFSHWIDSFKKAGFYPIIHASATAGMFVYPETRYHLVRSGAGLYGIWPSDMVKKAFEKNIKLEPVLSWRTIISETKKLPGGSGISYDLTETLTRDSTVAVCPVGYWHGFPRSLSSSGEVLVNGVRAKVLGRVAMDMIIIDVTGIPDVKTGTVVTLIGTDGEEKISAEEVAERAGTTSYEILTRLNPLIQKIKI